MGQHARLPLSPEREQYSEAGIYNTSGTAGGHERCPVLGGHEPQSVRRRLSERLRVRLSLRPHPLAVAAVVDGETLVLSPDLRFLKLDEVGAFIWERIQAGDQRDAIVRSITETYEVSAEQAGADVDVFIGHLISEGLVEADSETGV